RFESHRHLVSADSSRTPDPFEPVGMLPQRRLSLPKLKSSNPFSLLHHLQVFGFVTLQTTTHTIVGKANVNGISKHGSRAEFLRLFVKAFCCMIPRHRVSNLIVRIQNFDPIISSV